ncbi:uncharacterized protein J3R85_019589 [Psidium guajava]|nr:uncharacterized protein J3R85_019589 [Psidium guajava]
MHDVSNPIIIEQNYCDQDEPCKQQKSAVKVKNVTYPYIRGTSASVVAVEFNCSESFPCEGIALQNINLQKTEGGSTTASCNIYPKYMAPFRLAPLEQICIGDVQTEFINNNAAV